MQNLRTERSVSVRQNFQARSPSYLSRKSTVVKDFTPRKATTMGRTIVSVDLATDVIYSVKEHGNDANALAGLLIFFLANKMLVQERQEIMSQDTSGNTSNRFSMGASPASKDHLARHTHRTSRWQSL